MGPAHRTRWVHGDHLAGDQPIKERYKEAEIDRHIEQDPERFQQVLETKKQKFLGASDHNHSTLFSVATLEQIATGAARAEIARLIPFPTFEAFCDQERRRQDGPASGPPPIGGEQEENHCREHPPWNGRTLTRGLEFGVSPMPEPRRRMIDRGSLFGAPGYRWIPARSRVTVEYCAFIGRSQSGAGIPVGEV